ncbi:MAG: hypothetical protein K2N38_14170 [Oscillospiraceae bacterium]|nr:hypothetical protein [Oscillospiraceae bacterium]
MKLTVIVGESHAELGDCPVVKARGGASVDCPFAAVIVGKGAEVEVSSALGVIADGSSFRQKLPRGIQLITCGISPKNTVSVTSRTSDRLTLALNRSVRTASGVCEPLEQPVDAAEDEDEYDIMAAFAARIILGLPE